MTTPQQGSCSTRPPVGCGGACMSTVALLATVVQRIRIAYSSIRIEITYPDMVVMVSLGERDGGRRVEELRVSAVGPGLLPR